MKKSKSIPSQQKTPGQDRYDHGVPFVGPTNARPTNDPAGEVHHFPVKTPTPSRFNEFMNRSHTDTQKHEE